MFLFVESAIVMSAKKHMLLECYERSMS